MILDYIVWVIAILSTIFLFTSTYFDTVTLLVFKNIGEKENKQGGTIRTVLVFIMAFAWSYIIVF